MKKRLTLITLAILAGSIALNAQDKKEKSGELEAEPVGQSELVVITLEDGSRELYRPATKYWNDDPVFTYRHCRGRYNTKGYIDSPIDPYRPFAAGLLGVLCPGLGHVYDGEILRGMGFFYGTVLAGGAASALLSNVDDERYDPQYGYIYERNETNATLGTLFVAGAIGLYVWNIIDAAKVAKVKNLYFRDLVGRPSALGIDVHPQLYLSPFGNPIAGAGLQLKF